MPHYLETQLATQSLRMSPERTRENHYFQKESIREVKGSKVNLLLLLFKFLLAFLSCAVAEVARNCESSCCRKCSCLQPLLASTKERVPPSNLGNKRECWENRVTVVAASTFQLQKEWSWYLGPLWQRTIGQQFCMDFPHFYLIGACKTRDG